MDGLEDLDETGYHILVDWSDWENNPDIRPELFPDVPPDENEDDEVLEDGSDNEELELDAVQMEQSQADAGIPAEPQPGPSHRQSSPQPNSDLSEEPGSPESGQVHSLNGVLANEQGNTRVMRGRDGSEWTTRRPNQRVRQPPHVLFRQRPGPIDVNAEHTFSDIFKMMMTPEIVEMIVRHSNQYGEAVVRQYNVRRTAAGKRLLLWKPITSEEVYAFCGWLYWCGANRQRKTPVNQLYSTRKMFRQHFYPAVMSRDQFRLLTRVLRFDDRASRHANRGNVPKDEPVRELLRMFNERIRVLYNPGRHITVDETLVTFRGRAPFRVYIKTKPGRYGLKVWTAVDVLTSYVLNFQLYTGRGEQREVNQGRRVVIDLLEPWYRTGRTVTTDNFFTSLALAIALREVHLSLIGTMRANRKEVADELKRKEGRQPFDSLFGEMNGIVMVSYYPGRGKNLVLALSTYHRDFGISADPAKDKKPEILLKYNETKGGVDAADQMFAELSCARVTERWPMQLFYAVLNIASLNTFKLYMSLHPNWNSLDPGCRRANSIYQLARELVTPYMQIRSRTVTDKSVKESMQIFAEDAGIDLEFPVPAHQEQVPEAPRQSVFSLCYICPGRKTARARCTRCIRPVCKPHQRKIILCNNCNIVLPPRL